MLKRKVYMLWPPSTTDGQYQYLPAQAYNYVDVAWISESPDPKLDLYIGFYFPLITMSKTR